MPILQWKNKRAYAVYHEIVDGKPHRNWTPLGKFNRKVDGHEAFVKHCNLNIGDEKLAQFKDLEPQFWQHYKTEHSEITALHSANHWKQIKKEFWEDWIIGVDVKRIEDFKNKFDSKWGISTFKIRLVLLKQFLAYAKTHGFKTSDPFAIIKIKQKKLHEYDLKAPIKEDVDKLLAYMKGACNEHNYLTALFLAYTGMRPIEFIRLKKEDIQKDRIKVEAKKKIRWIPLHPKLQKHVKKLPFVISNDSFHSSLQRACRVVFDEYNRITPYAFRHYFATELLRKTKNIRLVSQIMGHSDIQITARYAWVLDDEQKAGVEMLD